jgi:hypothetical protein
MARFGDLFRKKMRGQVAQGLGKLQLLLPLLLYLTLASSWRATAGILPALDLKAMAEGADLIAVGRVVDVGERGPGIAQTPSGDFAARGMAATLEVERLLKGSGGARLDFEFLIPEQMIGYWPIGKGQFGVFFLRQDVSGYQVFDPYHPYVEAFPGTPSANGSIFEKIIAEMAGVLTSPGSSGNSRRLAIHALDVTPGAASTAALVQGAQQQNEEVRLRSAAALFRRNDITFLNQAVGLLLNPPSGLDPDLLDDMSLGIGVGVTSPKATSSLVRLLGSPRVATRRAAAQALACISGSSIVAPLAGALYDSDRQVRYWAVTGLARATGQNPWYPSLGEFQENEDRYVNHWREWAQSNVQTGPAGAER